MPDFTRAQISNTTEDLTGYKTFLRKLTVGQTVTLPLEGGETSRKVMRALNAAASQSEYASRPGPVPRRLGALPGGLPREAHGQHLRGGPAPAGGEGEGDPGGEAGSGGQGLNRVPAGTPAPDETELVLDVPAAAAIAAAAGALRRQGLRLTLQTAYSVAFTADPGVPGGPGAGGGQVAVVPVQLKPEWCRVWVTVRGSGPAVAAAAATWPPCGSGTPAPSGGARARGPSTPRPLAGVRGLADRLAAAGQGSTADAIEARLARFKLRWDALGKKAAARAGGDAGGLGRTRRAPNAPAGRPARRARRRACRRRVRPRSRPRPPRRGRPAASGVAGAGAGAGVTCTSSACGTPPSCSALGAPAFRDSCPGRCPAVAPASVAATASSCAGGRSWPGDVSSCAAAATATAAFAGSASRGAGAGAAPAPGGEDCAIAS